MITAGLLQELINAEVQELLKKGAIPEVNPSDQGLYSDLFLFPKKEGTYRPVTDLSSLNRFVHNSHFHMENLHCLKTLCRRGDYMTSINLKDAYFSDPCMSPLRGFSVSSGAANTTPFRVSLWAKFSSPNLHQTREPSSLFSQKAGVPNHSVLRRFPSPCLLQGGSSTCYSNDINSIAITWLPHKLDKINTVPNSDNNIPWVCHKLTDYDHSLSGDKGAEGPCSLQQCSLSTLNNRQTPGQCSRHSGVL